MAWCEAQGVDYLLGLAKNERLKAEIEKEMEEDKSAEEVFNRPAVQPGCSRFIYQTQKPWSRARRVVGPGQHLDGPITRGSW